MLSQTFVALLLSTLALSSPLTARNEDNGGLNKICHHLKTENKGCVRYTRGFDVTGVVTEVDLTFPQVKNKCDCIQECLNRPASCANYVYKFSTADAVKSGHRTCTLYSNFNLPSGVATEFDLNSANNVDINAAAILANGNNPQKGGAVPAAFKDINLNTVPDHDAFSGPVWQLANGKVQC